ncbi:MAG: hypothetical protein U0K66_05460 [Paludibacteraceae bacterium]|nr:hypothetical protein [Paludibacteraceae bacterium]
MWGAIEIPWVLPLDSVGDAIGFRVTPLDSRVTPLDSRVTPLDSRVMSLDSV